MEDDDLSRQSLEKCIAEIAAMTKDRGECIALRPTRMVVPRDPSETDEEYKARVACIQAKLEWLEENPR